MTTEEITKLSGMTVEERAHEQNPYELNAFIRHRAFEDGYIKGSSDSDAIHEFRKPSDEEIEEVLNKQWEQCNAFHVKSGGVNPYPFMMGWMACAKWYRDRIENDKLKKQ